jgi:zona occludens toxin
VITLLTGVPGSGKTLNAIRMVDKEWGESNRDIYYRGIRELSADLGWTEISDSDLQNWWTFPDGSIFVIDEVQQVWPRRSPNHPAPEAVSRLDTHRHRGFDFYIISQKPKNFDFEIRGYVGRHLHFERGYGREGTRQLEWQTACDDPDDYHRRQEANVTRIKFDKSYYSKYHSAEVHTFKKRIPKQFYVFGGAVFLTLFAFGFAFNNIMSRMDEPQSAQSVNPLTDQTNSDSGLFSGLPTGSPNREQVKTTEEYLAERVPRIEGMDWSAPIYDGDLSVYVLKEPFSVSATRSRLPRLMYPRNCATASLMVVSSITPERNAANGRGCRRSLPRPSRHRRPSLPPRLKSSSSAPPRRKRNDDGRSNIPALSSLFNPAARIVTPDAPSLLNR